MNTTDKIARLLEKGRTLTALQALKQFDCLRLGARIHDLRKAGMNIETIDYRLPNGKHIAKYKLIKP